MKKLIFFCLLATAGLQPNKICAQISEPFTYYGLDSVSAVNDIHQVLEYDSCYFLVNYSAVLRLNKFSGVIDTILMDVAEYITHSFIDSIGNLGIITLNKLKLFQANSWQTINIPSYNNYVKGALVDSGGVICIGFQGDSIFSYNYVNWTKEKILFPNTNEHLTSLIAGPNHECRFYSSVNNTHTFYQKTGSALTQLNQVTAATGFTYDSSGRLWYEKTDSLFNVSPTGLLNFIVLPLHGYQLFQINESGTKAWVSRLYGNDSLYFYNGSNWQLIHHLDYYFSSSAWGNIKALSNDRLAYVEYNQHAYSDEVSRIRIFKNELQEAVYATNKKFIGARMTSVVVSPGGWSYPDDYIIGTETGVVQKKDTWSGPSNFVIWDTTNTTLTTQSIYSLAIKTGYFSGNADTLYIGTDKGLFVGHFENDSLKIDRNYNSQNSILPNDTIGELANDNYLWGNNSDLWIGFKNDGVTQLKQDGTMVNYNTSNSLLPSNHVNGIRFSGYNNDEVYISTTNGFLIINDTVQLAFTPSNTLMIDSNISTAAEWANYGNGKKEYFVGTYGNGFALVDTSGQWHYYNPQNLNADADTVYFIAFNVFSQPTLIGTNKGLKTIGGHPYNATTNDLEIQFSTGDFRNYKFDYRDVMCGKGGYRFVSLCDRGVVRYEVCLGGTTDIADGKMPFKAWFNGNDLNFELPFKSGVTIELFNLTGQKIISRIIAKPQAVNHILFSGLCQGIYLLRAYNTERSVTAKIYFTGE